jgi:hypothetical protein
VLEEEVEGGADAGGGVGPGVEVVEPFDLVSFSLLSKK